MSAFREGEPLPARFDWTFNLGHLGIIFTLVTGLGGLIWNESAARSVLAEGQAQDRRDINSLLARGAVWQPKVEALERSNNVQDERIQNLSQSTSEIRRTLSDIGVNMGQLREDMATVRARLGVERRTELMVPNDPKRGSP